MVEESFVDALHAEQFICLQRIPRLADRYHTLIRVSEPARKQYAVYSIDSLDVSKRASVRFLR